MSKLIPLSEWCDKTFDDPKPHPRTLQRMAAKGEIPSARKFGRVWYVNPALASRSTGNALVDRVLGASP